MWKSSVRGIVSSQTDFSFSNHAGTDVERICDEIFTILDELPWFHRVPILIVASATTMICFVRYWSSLDGLDREKRQQFIDKASKWPFWGLFRRLIGSIALLHYFDNQTIMRNAKLGRLRS